MLRILEIDCKTCLMQLWDYLDEELTEERMAMVRAHLERCSGCLPHAKFGERFLAALQRCKDESDLPASLRDRVLTRLREEGLAGPS